MMDDAELFDAIVNPCPYTAAELDDILNPWTPELIAAILAGPPYTDADIESILNPSMPDLAEMDAEMDRYVALVVAGFDDDYADLIAAILDGL